MNIVLFDPGETAAPLPLSDPRVRHILDVLRRRPGDDFDAGLIDGPRGKARIDAIEDHALYLSFRWDAEPPALEPITLLAGLPRPQTARKVLEEATALGVQAIHFVRTARGEPGYARSRLWTTGEWRRHAIAGAGQAFTTRLPAITWDRDLGQALAGLPGAGARLALDNYEAPERLGELHPDPPVTLAVGPERGWTGEERALLLRTGFRFAHLGERVLRVETACVASIALVRAALGRM